ncbi:MAG TPA: hypothetical protein DEP04_05310 [Dehalococcoidia bacterium]|nr:hypothetical protein [Dehalococcoidia bacterium]
MISILFVGGSGNWAEKHYYSALYRLRADSVEFKISVICDIVNPEAEDPTLYAVGRDNLRCFLSEDRPEWLRFDRDKPSTTIMSLDELHAKYNFGLVIISCDPNWHFFYSTWAIKKGINTVCEKPPLLTNCPGSNQESALTLARSFDELNRLVDGAKKNNPSYLFHIPLKNRRLRPFCYVSTNLQNVYERTGQGITHVNLTVNNGLHRFNTEFLNEGAHGYLDGIGSLAHSSYHYIDLIAWFVLSARADISSLRISVPYVMRIRDYVSSAGYSSLGSVLGCKDDSCCFLPENVLSAELDFSISIALCDSNHNLIGNIAYHSNHMSFSSRTLGLDSNVMEPGNHKDGGKMKQVLLDVHQGAMQNFILIRNHDNNDKKSFALTHRCHPAIGESVSELVFDDDLYIKGSSTEDLLRLFLTGGHRQMDCRLTQILSAWREDQLTHRIFAACYELISRQSSGGIGYGESLEIFLD